MAPNTKRILDKTCVSTALLCEFFGISRQALSKWEKRGCPNAARGYWCVADVLAWRDGAVRESDQSVENLPLTQQKIYWETRCKEEQAENQQFKNAILRGDYLEKSKVEQDLSAFFVVFKQAALLLPRKAAIAASSYIGAEKGRKLENELLEVVNHALEQWSRGDVSAVDTKRPARPAAAKKNDGNAVGGRKKAVKRSQQQ